jgi:PAS domain S-box-containing protein
VRKGYSTNRLFPVSERVDMAATVVWFDQHSSERLHELLGKAIIDSADDAIISKDLQGIIRSWNTGAERLFGYSAAEAVGHSVTMLIPPEKQNEEPRILERLRRGERVEHFETVRITKDGRRVPISLMVSPIVDHDGRIIGASKIARDLSAQQRAGLTEAYLAAIVDSAEDAIISKDLNGIVQSWNNGAQRLFGYSAEEMVGKPITTLFPPERLSEEDMILGRLRRGERVEHYETVRVAKDGHRIPISLTMSPIKDHAGRVVGASKIARDISDRKRLESATKEADRRKDEFLAMLAHELRNPLTPIKTALEIIQSQMSDASRREWALQVIDRQLTQLTRIIDDLLELGRIAHGQFFLRKETTTLRAVVATAIETSRPAVLARHHALRVELPLLEVPLHVDPVRIAQALSNLLNNAAKFTEPGGTISVGASVSGQMLELRVRDSGRGLDPALLPKVFDMFVQGEQDLARSEGGLGIGLSVVRRIAELHGGGVSARSAGKDRGSEFIIMLPLVEGPAHAFSTPAPITLPDVWRILIVDDNHDVTDALAELLSLDGHVVERYYHGEGALETAVAFAPDLLLMDLGLPGKNGYDVARLIRAYPGMQALPIIAISGYGQPADVQRGRAAGFDYHLLKPIDHQRLQQAIDAVMSSRRQSPNRP